MIIFATLVVWFVLAIATGFAAQSRGRDGVGWFLLAILISPPLALILLIAFPSRFVGPSKICQFCTSQVAEAALVCPHCHKEIDTPEGTQARQTARERQRRLNYSIAGIVAAMGIPIWLLSRPAPPPTQVSSPSEEGVIVESQTWEKGVNAIVDLVVANKGTYDVRQVAATCAFYSEADKQVASSSRALFGVIRPGRWQFQKVDFGPANSQAVTISCWISAFTKAGTEEARAGQNGASNRDQAQAPATDTSFSYSTSEAILRKYCEQKWPTDFRMRAYCEDQGRQAVKELSKGSPTDIDQTKFSIVRRQCADKWQEDFRMRLYCENQAVDRDPPTGWALKGRH